MSENVPEVLLAGFAALDGGVDTSSNPTIASDINPNGLSENQLSNAVNCTVRGGLGVTHRPPFMQRVLQFPNDFTLTGFDSSALWQGSTVHEAEQTSLLVSTSGRFFQVKVEEQFRVIELTLPNDPDPSNLNFCWFVQAGPFTVKQSGEGPPLIFDGSTLRRAVDGEIRAGQAMAFSQGRIWYATYDASGRVTRFRATDLIGSSSGTAQYQAQDAVLKETENTFLTSGDFSARSDMGEIRAMVVPRMLDTSLGQGPLQIFCERGALSCNAPVDRTQWQSVTYPIETESQFDYGALGARFATNFNGDILYRSVEGFHSFQLSRSDFKSWLNVPISREVDRYLKGDPEPLLYYGCGVNFDSRFVATCMPRNTIGGVVHDGLVALDIDLVSTLRKRDNPAWEGLWTGLSVLQIVKGTFGKTERCFIWARNTTGQIELWELLATYTDEIWDNGIQPITWSFETPAYDYGKPQDLKRLVTAGWWVNDLQETVTYRLQWRPDQHPCYADWHSWQQCGPVRQCGPYFEEGSKCGTLRNLRPQYRPKFKMPVPPDLCDDDHGIFFRDGFEHQFRIQVTGHVVVRKVVFASLPRPEPFLNGCPTVEDCIPLECCGPDPMEYSSSPLHGPSSESNPDDPYAPPTPPIIFNPPPPIDYPEVQPEDPNTQLVNPPGAVSPPPQPPFPAPQPTPATRNPTVNLPGVPSGAVLYPNPITPPLPGLVFNGGWTQSTTGLNLEIGSVTVPPDGLPDNVFTSWSQTLWQQFSDYVTAIGFSVQNAQIQVDYSGDDIGGGSAKRWFATSAFPDPQMSSYGLSFVLAIHYN